VTETTEPDVALAAYEMSKDAVDLHRQGELEQAATKYGEVVATFGDSSDAYVHELVVHAIGYRASIRFDNPKLASRTEPTSDLAAQFERTAGDELRTRLANAIMKETMMLAVSGRAEEALALNERLVTAVHETDCAQVRRQAAVAAQNVVGFLDGQGRTAEAEEALRDVAVRFGEDLLADYDEESPEDDRDTRLGLRYRKAELLRVMGRRDEAAEAFTAVISEFGDHEDVKPVIDRARARLAALQTDAT
jgi:tetratricopeptide (TPR) repeat protein